MMKALVIDEPGTPETLRLTEMPQPEPGEGEVRVKVYAAGLNPADYKFMKRGFKSWSYPFVPGLDVAGVIDEIGAGVSDWKVGDAVYYHGNLSKPGGFAEEAITTARTLARLPDNLSFVEAAALPCAGWTAYQALHRKLHIEEGQTILVQGGAGGVGGFALQLARLAGVKAIATCSQRHFEWVRKLGAIAAIDYNTENVGDRVREITNGRGVDAIVDGVSSATATAGLELLAFGGGIVCVSGLPDFSKFQSFNRALSVHDIALGGAYFAGDTKAQDELARIGREFGKLAGDRQIDPMVAEVISLEEIPEGLIKLSQRHVRGKIVASIKQ
ncbi:MAG: zinc-binding dehydrogenase [Oscillatoria sp. SIO1A7]|nr:zinc-binding dehydrogenase [Oscillatoria sp. SIO1A7]